MKKTELRKYVDKEISRILEDYQEKIQELKKEGVKKLPKNPLEKTYIVAYETNIDNNKFDSRTDILSLKANSDRWIVNFFDEQQFQSIIEHGNLGFSRKELIFLGKDKKRIDFQKTLEKLEKDGYIVVFNNPKKTKTQKKSTDTTIKIEK